MLTIIYCSTTLIFQLYRTLEKIKTSSVSFIKKTCCETLKGQMKFKFTFSNILITDSTIFRNSDVIIAASSPLPLSTGPAAIKVCVSFFFKPRATGLGRGRDQFGKSKEQHGPEGGWWTSQVGGRKITRKAGKAK